MPEHVIHRVNDVLNLHASKGLNGAKILLMGMAYKKNVDDMRESPSLILTQRLKERGALVDYHDPFIPEIKLTREHAELAGMASVPISAEVVQSYDLVLISTDHDEIDYDELVAHARLVVDTRNATKGVTHNRQKIVKA